MIPALESVASWSYSPLGTAKFGTANERVRIIRKQPELPQKNTLAEILRHSKLWGWGDVKIGSLLWTVLF